jgi:hypothetical protein
VLSAGTLSPVSAGSGRVEGKWEHTSDKMNVMSQLHSAGSSNFAAWWAWSCSQSDLNWGSGVTTQAGRAEHSSHANI